MSTSPSSSLALPKGQMSEDDLNKATALAASQNLPAVLNDPGKGQ